MYIYMYIYSYIYICSYMYIPTCAVWQRRDAPLAFCSAPPPPIFVCISTHPCMHPSI